MKSIEKLWLEGKYVAMGNLIINKTVERISKPFSGFTAFFLLLLLALLLVFLPCPSRFQYMLLRMFTSICFAFLLSPVLDVKTGIYQLKGVLTIVLVLLTYLVNPAELIKKDPCHRYAYANGKVLLGQEPLRNAQIRLPHFDYATISNGQGEFVLQWEKEELKADSLLITIDSKGSDTSFYWKTHSPSLLVYLPDTLVPITQAIISELLQKKIEDYENYLSAKRIEWGKGDSISLEKLIQVFGPYKHRDANKRNEYVFEGSTQKLKFKTNLEKAGIDEVVPLEPYQKHHFDSCSIYLLKSSPFPFYTLHYLMCNQTALSYKILQLQYIANDYYKVSIAYHENIRSIKVELACNKETNGVKLRQMKVYGFLPVEDYELRFKQGKWELT